MAAQGAAEESKRSYELELAAMRRESIAGGPNDALERKQVSTLKLEVPKFDAKTDVATYFEVFESIVKENGIAPKNWHLYLRNASAGTKLASIIDDFADSYEVLKKEALLAFGSTASSSWRELLSCRQGSETFRQFNYRVARLVKKWLKLALDSGADEEHTIESEVACTLVKQIVLESIPAGMCAFLLRQRREESGFEAFIEAGSSHQAAYGLEGSRQIKDQDKGQPKPKTSPTSSTAQCLAVVCDEAQAKMPSMPVGERRSYVLEHRLCLNCLRAGSPL